MPKKQSNVKFPFIRTLVNSLNHPSLTFMTITYNLIDASCKHKHLENHSLKSYKTSPILEYDPFSNERIHLQELKQEKLINYI